MTGSDPSRVNIDRDATPSQMWNGLAVLILGDLWSIGACFGLLYVAYSLIFGVTYEFLGVVLTGIAIVFSIDTLVILRNTILYGYPFR